MSLSFSCRKHSTVSTDEEDDEESKEAPETGISGILRVPTGGLDLSEVVVWVSVKELNFLTGILMDRSAKKSCSVKRLLARFMSATCYEKTLIKIISVD